MDLFGSYALLLAFAFALYAIFGGIAAIITRRPLLIKSARNAGFAVEAVPAHAHGTRGPRHVIWIASVPRG